MSENPEIVMQAKHIVKQFPASHGRTLTACNDVNLTMYKGRTLGIVGESGCGKSTFVRMVISLDQPTSGEVLYHGKNITGLSKKEPGKTVRICRWFFRIRWASFNPKMKIRDNSDRASDELLKKSKEVRELQKPGSFSVWWNFLKTLLTVIRTI